MASQFELGVLIGEGGFGSVFRALRAGQPCAAKRCNVSHADLQQDAVKKEIDILQQLRHRYIIQYFDTIDHEGHTYIVTDLAEKGSLAEAIVRGEVTDWPTKNRIAHEIARGLEYIHSCGILHRDLKAANVLLTQFMEVRLCDFGLAKVKTTSSSKSRNSFQGTVRWAAPETLQMRHSYSTKSDVYALGMVMWAMAANRPVPFDDQHHNAVIAEHIKKGHREVIPESTPPKYCLLIKRCWDQAPERRPNARDVVLMENEWIPDELLIDRDREEILSFSQELTSMVPSYDSLDVNIVRD
ncbi:hypothetical protein BGW42_008242 [Actinomortierella wolfii]|nr:hypothetical protein BGW42_008242 [Actinomortierella wolfii]